MKADEHPRAAFVLPAPVTKPSKRILIYRPPGADFAEFVIHGKSFPLGLGR